MKLTEQQKAQIQSLLSTCKNCQCWRCLSPIVNKRCWKCERIAQDYRNNLKKLEVIRYDQSKRINSQRDHT